MFLVCFRHMTVCDSIERSLRKGKSAEQGAAADLAALLCVQLGAGTVVDEVSRVLRPTLSYVANDNSFAATARAKVSVAYFKQKENNYVFLFFSAAYRWHW